jgi:hypothetical protein
LKHDAATFGHKSCGTCREMWYEICLAMGSPGDSEVTEGTGRNLINDRLELTGMCWKPRRKESMVHLRSVHVNKDRGTPSGITDVSRKDDDSAALRIQTPRRSEVEELQRAA